MIQIDNTPDRISAAFDRCAREGRSALMPFVTVGFPDLVSTRKIVKAISPHCDLVELGFPFSDPLADGPTIQASTQHALEQGVTLQHVLELVSEMRGEGLAIPIILMGYYNPLLAYGLERFAADAMMAGVDGVIVADLPNEESVPLRGLLAARNLSLIAFAAPTSGPERILAAARVASGFIYLVSMTGVTGSSGMESERLAPIIRLIRQESDIPVAVGFGVESTEQVRRVSALAEGVIVGSALTRVIDRAAEGDEAAAAARFVSTLRSALVLNRAGE